MLHKRTGILKYSSFDTQQEDLLPWNYLREYCQQKEGREGMYRRLESGPSLFLSKLMVKHLLKLKELHQCWTLLAILTQGQKLSYNDLMALYKNELLHGLHWVWRLYSVRILWDVMVRFTGALNFISFTMRSMNDEHYCRSLWLVCSSKNYGSIKLSLEIMYVWSTF